MNRNVCVSVTATVALAGLFCCGVAQCGQDDKKNVVTAPYEELVGIMKKVKGYKPLMTTNAVRFQSEVIFYLIEWAKQKHPDADGVLLGHKKWFRASLAVNNVRKEDAPGYMKLAYQNKQDMRIVFKGEEIVKPGNVASSPDASAHIRTWWPKTPGCAKEFRFVDTNSVPVLRVTNKRVITYRVMRFGDMIVCDKINGISGRPLTGLLGLVFKVLGEVRVVESRTIVSRDNLQIVRAYCKKGPVGIWAMSTVYPDGHAIKGIPKARPDLQRIASRLSAKPKVQF